MTTHKLFLTIILIAYLCKVHCDWVDPHSMDRGTKPKIRRFSEPDPIVKEEYCHIQKQCNSDLYLKRIVRLILKNAYLDIQEGMEHFSGHINLQLTRRDYDFLEKFSQNADTKEEIFSEVGSIFEIALQKPSLERYKEVMLTIEEQIYFLIFNPTTGAFVGSVIFLYIVYKLLRAKFTWKSIIKYIVFIGYVADFIITYLEIRKEEEIKNVVAFKKLGSVPPECDAQKLSWWKYMKTQFESTFFEHPCKSYYDMVANTEMQYLVAPTKILTRQFKTVLVDPIENLGEAFGKFGRQMFTNLPWGLNIAIFPIMLIASCLIIFIVLLFITKPRFKVSLFHFFTLEIGDSPRIEPSRIKAKPAERRVRRKEVGYNNAQHRALIEDASNDNSSSNQKNIDAKNGKNGQKCIENKKAKKDGEFVDNLGPSQN